MIIRIITTSKNHTPHLAHTFFRTSKFTTFTSCYSTWLNINRFTTCKTFSIRLMCNLFSSSTSRRTISMSTAITWFILKFFFTISTNGFYISNYITNFALYSFTIFIFISNIFRSRCKTNNYFNFRVLGKFSKILELPKDYAIFRV